MGSNMQRQTVPLLRSDAPLVGTGMELPVARDSGAAVTARRSVSLLKWMQTVLLFVTEELRSDEPVVDIYKMMKFQRSNQSALYQPETSGENGRYVEGRHHLLMAINGIWRLALGENVLVAFMPWNGYNFEFDFAV